MQLAPEDDKFLRIVLTSFFSYGWIEQIFHYWDELTKVISFINNQRLFASYFSITESSHSSYSEFSSASIAFRQHFLLIFEILFL